MEVMHIDTLEEKNQQNKNIECELRFWKITVFQFHTDLSNHRYSKSGIYITEFIREFSEITFCQKITLHFSHEFSGKTDGNKTMLCFCRLII